MEAAHSLYRNFGFRDIEAYPEMEIAEEFKDYLLFMERIAEYIHGYTFIKLKQDHKTVDAVIRNFEVIEPPSHTHTIGA